LAPRLSFRNGRQLPGRQSGVEDPAAARQTAAYGEHMMRLLMKDDCDVAFHHVKLGGTHRTVQVGEGK
jgi:hypothetical protein